MKRVQVLLSILFTAFVATSQAQTIKSPTVDEYRNMVIKAVRRSAAQVTAGKTTATKQRLKAYANYNVSPVPGKVDSAMFFYSGNNGSAYNKNEMDFVTESFNPTFEPIVDMSPYMYRTDIMENEFDSTVIFAYDSATQSLQPMTMIAVDYHAAKMPSVLSAIDYSNGVPEAYKMICAYDANGKMLSAKVVDPQASNDTVVARYFFYNTQGKVVRDSSIMNYNGAPVDFMKYEYTYDVPGKLVSLRSWMGFTGTWEEMSKIELGWNSQNKINKVTTLQWDGTAYQAVGQDSLGYNTAGDVITYTLTRELDMNMQLINKSYELIKLNAQGLPDTALVYANINGTWMLESKATMSYNTYGNPDWKKMDILVGGTVTETYEKKYYYELYNDNSTGVDGNDYTNAVSIYPNPATTDIKVRWLHANDIKATIQVYSLTGYLMTPRPIQLSGEATVSISRYPAGQYILIIKNDKGVLINRQSFIKM